MFEAHPMLITDPSGKQKIFLSLRRKYQNNKSFRLLTILSKRRLTCFLRFPLLHPSFASRPQAGCSRTSMSHASPQKQHPDWLVLSGFIGQRKALKNKTQRSRRPQKWKILKTWKVDESWWKLRVCTFSLTLLWSLRWSLDVFQRKVF